jgi:hypothetical protein
MQKNNLTQKKAVALKTTAFLYLSSHHYVRQLYCRSSSFCFISAPTFEALSSAKRNHLLIFVLIVSTVILLSFTAAVVSFQLWLLHTVRWLDSIIFVTNPGASLPSLEVGARAYNALAKPLQ